MLPLHVRESHYVLTDVPLTFFVTLTLLLSLRAHERGDDAAFALGRRRGRAGDRDEVQRRAGADHAAARVLR